MYNNGASVSVWRAPGVWGAQSWGSGFLALDLSLTGCFRQVAQSPCSVFLGCPVGIKALRERPPGVLAGAMTRSVSLPMEWSKHGISRTVCARA